MRTKLVERVLVAAVVAALSYGIARSATSRYAERRQAIVAGAKAEQTRLGLTDRKALFAKHPTPEIKLCRGVAVLPGASAEVAVQGRFEPGTKFLFENDGLEVVKESLTAAEYRATVSAARNLGPSYAYLHAFAPVSAGYRRCLAVVVGGRYEWDFAADNGWRVRLKPLSQSRPEPGQLPEQVYQAEFFHGAEGQAFAAFDAKLDIGAAPFEDSYTARLTTEPQNPGMAAMEKLQQQMMNLDKLSEKEQEQLLKRMEQLAATMEAQATRQVAAMQERQRKLQELGCTEIHFRLEGVGWKGHLACQAGRPVNIKGAMKFIGPW